MDKIKKMIKKIIESISIIKIFDKILLKQIKVSAKFKGIFIHSNEKKIVFKQNILVYFMSNTSPSGSET